MAKKASDFRYNTGETKVPWAAVGENYNAEDLMAIVRFLMKGEGEEYDAAIKAVEEKVYALDKVSEPPAKLSLDAEVAKAEEMCDEFLNTEGCVFLTNCTAGFEIASKYANLQPGDEVIVPAITFAATMAYPLSIGCKIVFLVPGLLFTNAMRDIIFGDTNSGVNRVVEALLIAVAVALGTAAAWNFTDVLRPLPQQAGKLLHSPLITCFFSFVACAGFVVVFNIHGKGKWFCALGGAITWGAYCVAEALGCDSLLCYFIATCTAAVFSEVMARVRKYPAISYLVISLLPLIPGAGIYYTALHAIRAEYPLAADYGMETLATAGVMAAGILVISTVVRMWTTRKKG